jgi:O-antigen/teichoic acid export membrane protein
LRFSSANWVTAKEMLAFGLKSGMSPVARLVHFQANAILVTWVLGPAALAVYSRPIALVRHVESFVNKLAFVLTPTASSMQAKGRHEDLKDLVIEASRYAAALALPALLFLSVLGNAILISWMGSAAYQRGDILAILAAGSFLQFVFSPAVAILRGLDRQGRVAILSAGATIVGIVLSVVLLGVWQIGLVGAALAVAIPQTASGLLVGAYVVRMFGVGPLDFVQRVFGKPVLCCLPFALTLLIVRAQLPNNPAATVILGAIVGGLVLAPFYWRFLLPNSVKARVVQPITAVALSLRGS